MAGPSFPELTSFGTLFSFAIAVEEAAAALAEAAAQPDNDPLRALAKRHRKRGRELERLRRERLNEVVLQAIDGMDRQDYLPPSGEADLAAVVRAEDRAAAFYEDAARTAANLLGGVDRTFRKLAEESRRLAAELVGG